MGSSRAQLRYGTLPRRDSESSLSSNDEFKDKPIVRRSLLRRLLSPFQTSSTSNSYFSRCCRPVPIMLLLSILLLGQVLFNAPYAASNAPAYVMDERETVYIAANIIDGDLITGAWGKSLVELVERIGKERVFVSIYGGPPAALKHLESMLDCPSSIVSEDDDPIRLDGIPHTSLPNGEKRVKRIAFLAEVRNKALQPMGEHKDAKDRTWDKVLFINDVYFHPEGAMRLLWGTNLNKEGRAEYKASCAADFVTSWKYYDTFATRDAEGYSIGVPIFPWFGSEGEKTTRRDVLGGRGAVRVRSCWGGMVAFDGRYFGDGSADTVSVGKRADSNNENENVVGGKGKGGNGVEVSLPLRFRSEAEPFWDSSECCLIHADIMALPDFPSLPISSSITAEEDKVVDEYDTGIYMNPFVRVAYDAQTFRHIALAIRFEALFALPQRVINYFAGMPRFNYRRAEVENEIVPDRLWIDVHSDKTKMEAVAVAEGHGPVTSSESSGFGKRETLKQMKGKEWWSQQGYYTNYNRTARRGGYCGVRQLLVVKEGPLAEGEGNWDNLMGVVPPLNL